jgi:hypothetical protein
MINKKKIKKSYSQTAKQEFLCYQLAFLVLKTYDRLSKNLGIDFDNSASAQEYRLKNWVAPVFFFFFFFFFFLFSNFKILIKKFII